jgi:hypothetical protein
MAFSYSFGANAHIDAPRMLIADTDSTHPIFDDREIELAYTIDAPVIFAPGNGGTPASYGSPSYRRVAAALLDALASNRARLSGAIDALDIKADIKSVAAALKAQADNYRKIDDESATCAFIEIVQDVFTWRTRVFSQWLRQFSA